MPSRFSTLAVICALVSMWASPQAHAIIDNYGAGPGVAPGDGLDDVWQALYNGWGLDPDGDDDADNCRNSVESMAGTDPHDQHDCYAVGGVALTETTVTFTFPAEADKKYRIVSDVTLGPAATFSTVEVHVLPNPGATELIPAADNPAQSITINRAGGVRFYKVEVSDLDADADGVSDWSELATGFDPDLPDTDDDGETDLVEIGAELTVPDLVSIVAAEAFASEDGPVSGCFEIKRTRSLVGATVFYSLAGSTASSPADYSLNPAVPVGSVVFAPGQRSASIFVNPATDVELEGSESVRASLTSADAGEFDPPVIVNPDEATVVIGNSIAPSGTGLRGRYYDNANSVYMHGGNFGQSGTYTYVRTVDTGGVDQGTITIPYTGAGVAIGHIVRVTFLGGNLNNAAYNHMDYTVSAVNAGTNFTLAISATGLPTNSSSSCEFSFQSMIHPARIDRVDSTVNFEWMGGTPNGNSISPSNSPENYSTFWEGYLHPTTAGSYIFQLDADDKARVLLDLDDNETFDLPGEQIVEHGWDGPATVGTFKQSAAFALTVPADSSQRLKIRVEMVETTGEARCRLQWRLNAGGFANIPSANVFSHTSSMDANYNYTRTDSTPGAMLGTIVVTLNGHTYVPPNVVSLAFSSGNLFTPANGNFHADYTISAVAGNTFTVPIAAATLPTSGTGAGFVLNRPTSTTNAWFNMIYQNTTFTAPPGRVGTDSSGPVTSNNGLYSTGTPDLSFIAVDTFSVRWTGQMQPQFSEEYTIAVLADDGCRMWINGQEQDFRTAISSNVGGSTYTYVSATGEAVINYAGSAIVADSFAVGDIIRLDPTAGTLSSLATLDYTVTAATSTTVTVTFPTGSGDQATGASINIDSLNRVLKPWASMGSERYTRVNLNAGVRYDVVLEYYEIGGFCRAFLYWYSPSQPKQIIPTERLYPSDVPQAPAAHITPTSATALVGGSFSLPIAGSNGGNVTLSGNVPAWLTYLGGVLSGTPPPGAAGLYQIVVTITNAMGTSVSVINLQVDDTGGQIEREYWQPVTGGTVSDIPTGTAPTGLEIIDSLEPVTDFGNAYGVRIRGYLTAPETGNYYFWIAANNDAELWIANDDEPVNAFKRAWLTGGSSTPQTWDSEATQKSPWLALEQGERYYIEILHHGGTGAGITENLAVGWRKPSDPEGTDPSEVVPGYALSLYEPPPPATPGTLYVATLLAQGGAITNGVGTATLRVNEDETIAELNVTYHGLTGTQDGPYQLALVAADGSDAADGVIDPTDWHVHSDPYLAHQSFIIYDGQEPLAGDGPQFAPDSSFLYHKWNLAPAGTLGLADVRELLKQGKAYINLHTAAYALGEIRGNFTLAAGSRTFDPPPAPPTWTDDSNTDAGASRFLTQASFGPNILDITSLKGLTATSPVPAMPGVPASRYNTWIDNQFALPLGESQLDEVFRTEQSSAQGGAFEETLSFNAWWWQAISAPDQLRQRVAFALSQIHVVSGQGPLDNNALAISHFYDSLVTNSLGNFRDVLEATTLTPGMGRYLDMLRNDKPDLSIGRIPNENYAREIMQLFDLGLFRMWPDGTLILTSKDAPVDTYTQREIIGLSHVLTGWDYGYDGADHPTFTAAADWTRPMRVAPGRHYVGQKRILNNEVLPGLADINGQPLDPYTVHNTMHYNHPDYLALPNIELDLAHDQLFNHTNTGPFICRQLIQRMVTSHPSRDYLYRVVQAFNNNGSGVRGDMKAVVKAILLDYEARHTTDQLAVPAYGKQREPLLRVAAAARAFRPSTFSGTYSQAGTPTISVTTTTPHNLVSGNNVFLSFTDATPITPQPAPWIGSYSATVTGGTTLTVQAQGWVSTTTTGSTTVPMTYSIPSLSTVCTVNLNNHWLGVGNQFYADFTSGTTPPTDGVFTVATNPNPSNESPVGEFNNGNTFTFTVPAVAGARSGNLSLVRFNPGSYTSAAANPLGPLGEDRRITMDTIYDHHLSPGNQVQLNIYGGNPQPADMIATVESVVDLNTYTFVVSSAANPNFGTNQGDNSVYQFPLLSQPLTRNGTVGSRASTYQMNNTDGTLDQSPINADTVFNYFLPDYKYPGTLASQGITTPEFQLTAETSVVRQANYFYDGIFNPASNTNGTSSFSTGDNDLVLSYIPWMGDDATNVGLGLPTNTTVPWTHNQNIDLLVTQLSTLLTAGQMSVTAQQSVRDFVALPISSIPISNPCRVNTTRPHGFTTGDVVCISGLSTTGSQNGTFSPSDAFVSTELTYTITVFDTDTFDVTGVSCSQAPTATGVANAHVSPIVYNQGTTTPSASNRTNRMRAILHLIFTSPDFIIQR